MIKKSEGRKEEPKEESTGKKDNYTVFSKIWWDSYSKLYKPWIESTGDLLERMALLSKEATPQKYRDFFDEWIKTYQNTFGKYYPIPTPESNKEKLEKFLLSAEGYNKLCRSWIEELEDNSRKTGEILSGNPDPAKYKECHDMWIKSFEKIFDEIMELPAQESTKEILGNYMITPDIYSESFLQMSKLWKKSYAQLFKPLNESMMTFSKKMAEISMEDADPETYIKFYTLWINTYNEIYGKYFKSSQPSEEMFGHFLEGSNIYLGMYKSWITALEKMSEKAREMSKQTSDPEALKEYYYLWIKIYEKAFDSFFEDMPTIGGPMKEVMEPIKIMAKIYTHTFINMSKMRMRSDSGSNSAYPVKE